MIIWYLLYYKKTEPCKFFLLARISENYLTQRQRPLWLRPSRPQNGWLQIIVYLWGNDIGGLYRQTANGSRWRLVTCNGERWLSWLDGEGYFAELVPATNTFPLVLKQSLVSLLIIKMDVTVGNNVLLNICLTWLFRL